MKRATPCFDRWIKVAGRKLSVHGAKAELARHLSKRYGRPARSWESNIAQILARDLLPNAEVLLAIDAWLERQKPQKERDDKPNYS